MVPGRLKAQKEQRLQEKAGTIQKLLAAKFRIKRDGSLHGELDVRLKMSKERSTTEVFCFFTERQALSAEENQYC